MGQHITWIDTAKGLGLLLVILGHLHAPFLSSWIYTFHMPLFFILSGIVFSGTKYSFVEFLRRRIKTLVVPYFCLGTVIFLWYACIYYIQGKSSEEYVLMLKEFLLQRHYWTIWFLAALFFTEIIYYCINWITKSKLLFSSIISFLFLLFGFFRYRMGGTGLFWNLDVALIAQFFFHIGHIFKQADSFKKCIVEGRKLKRCSIVVFLLVINLVSGKVCIILSGHSLDMSIGMYGNEIATIASALSGSFAIICLCSLIQHSKYLNWLGRNTMVIFSWHSRIGIVGLGFMYEWMNVFQGDSILEKYEYTFVSFSLLLLIFIPLTLIIKRSRMHHLFGV